MAIFIGITMLLSIVGFAYMNASRIGERTRKEISRIIENELSATDRARFLKTGFVVIEFIYPINCTLCKERESIYREFMNDRDFSPYTVLSISAINYTNDIVERMTSPDGSVINLNNINNTDELRMIFCKNAIIKPDICLVMNL